MPNSSPRFLAYTKLRFFIRIRRFLQLKTSQKQSTPSDQFNKLKVREIDQAGDMERESEDGLMVVLRRSVKRLHFGSWEEKESAAAEIRRLAKEDLKLRKLMAELGVVPPLVAMVGSEVAGRRKLAVQALNELANGTYRNKALMVEGGILSALPNNVDALDEPTRHELALLLLSISSLVHSQFPLTSFNLFPYLVAILESNSSIETKILCLGTLYNLSMILDHAETMVTGEMVHTLLSLALATDTSEQALSTLGNLVVTLKGKKAMEENPMVPERLIEVLTWEGKPKCQEHSAYILMILAHQSSAQREKMARSGIVPVLLEVALLGSPLAQKRALKLLQWFKDERQAKMGPHSGPQTGWVGIGSPMINQKEINEGRKIMKNLVKQSLHKNFEEITRRASDGDDSTSKIKALGLSSIRSKSLPY